MLQKTEVETAPISAKPTVTSWAIDFASVAVTLVIKALSVLMGWEDTGTLEREQASPLPAQLAACPLAYFPPCPPSKSPLSAD